MVMKKQEDDTEMGNHDLWKHNDEIEYREGVIVIRGKKADLRVQKSEFFALFSDPDDEVRYVALLAYIEAISRVSHLIDQTGVSKILDYFSDQDPYNKELGFDAYGCAAEFTPQFIDKAGISKVLESFSDRNQEVRAAAICAYAKILRHIPELIDRQGVHKLVPLILDPCEITSERLFPALYAYKAAIEKTPQFITQQGINNITELFSNGLIFDGCLQKVVLDTYYEALIHVPQFIQETTLKIFELFSHPSERVRELAISDVFNSICVYADQFVTKEVIDMMDKLIDDRNCNVRNRAKRFAFIEVLEMRPQLIPERLNMILAHISMGDGYAADAYLQLIFHRPDIITQQAINKIVDILSECSYELEPGNEPHLKLVKYAFDAFEATLKIAPQLFAPTLSKFLTQFSDIFAALDVDEFSIPPEDVARRAFMLVIGKNFHFFRNEIRPKILEMLSPDKPEHVKLGGLYTYRAAIEQAPKLNDQAGVIKIIELFSDTDLHVRELALYAYKAVIETAPEFIDQTSVTRISKMFSDPSEYIRRMALISYKALIETAPELIDKASVTKMSDLLLDPNKYIRIPARVTCGSLLKLRPDLAEPFKDQTKECNQVMKCPRCGWEMKYVPEEYPNEFSCENCKKDLW